MLELTVFLSGALVMVLEMVGARVLAPHVGTSAVVWTSLIGVVLACLAVGAWAGGRLADKNLSRRGLAFALAGAGLGSGLTAFCHEAIGQWVTAAVGNLYAAAVLAAMCIFAVPAFFFGMITPYTIRLRIESVDSSGATVGRLYALSTAGSIVGTFLGGFILISYWGSTIILWGVAACMLGLSLCHGGGRLPLRAALLGLCVFMAVLAAQYGRWQDGRALSHLVESPYNSIRVYEGVDWAQNGRAVRLIATDPGYSQSGMYLDAPDELYFRYTQFYALGPHFVPEANRVLMLGGGGYSVPKWLLSEKSPLSKPAEARVTVVELDPAMTDTARRWFGLRDDARLSVRHEDARAFLNRQRDQYDLVFVDVFNSHYAVPFQMGTREAAAALRRAVAPGGVMLMNVISAVEGPDGRLFQGIFNALEQSFAEVQVYCAGGETPDKLQNLMVAAFPERRGAAGVGTAPAEAGPDAAEGAVSLSAMLASRYTGKQPFTTPALTDDFAPVERYTLVLLRQ
ncbi:fused MFS/spermidine synthase [Desulfovibrio sp.]|uniref:fused MFS/spermidine synthase n=1 Tax=Desulfovibrio sp. TaxID=885 RepID=UPI0035AE2811